MSIRFLVIKNLLIVFSLFKRLQFERSLNNPESAQKKILKRILNLTGRKILPEVPTNFGLYPASKSWTSETVNFYEPTSGSSGKRKMIPYTPSLLNSFQSMFFIWVGDILKYKFLKNGKIFISISPKLESMGMSSDLEYLSPLLQWVLKPFLTIPTKEFAATDGQSFLKKVAVRLLNSPDLEIISIWSPTYLISILDYILIHRAELENLVPLSVLNHAECSDWTAIWPKLKLISCWTDGSSQAVAKKIGRLFPNAEIQAKGILATEAPVSVPWIQAGGCMPLWNQVYLEYIDSNGQIKPLYAISIHQQVELLVSTLGGLVRYQLGDIVECTHFYNNSPAIKFIRRVGDVSDLVGEKLDSNLLQDVFKEFENTFWILVADGDHYVFVCERYIEPEIVETKLGEIYHYKLARELEQLRPLESRLELNLSEKISSYYLSKNMKLGDIKVRLLWSDSRILNFLDTDISTGSFLQ